jgi:cation:H+ antiporter
MTAIVIGTSLPELTMTVGAAKKGEFDLAVGNIIGTNIFNICIVLGLPTLIFGGYESNSFGIIDTLVVLLAAVAYYVFGRTNNKLTRREGVLMVMLFVAYYVYVLLV